MSIIENVVSRHADGASFKWLMRNRAVGAPHYKLDDLAHLDDGLNAYIDGLRVAGEEGWRIVQKAMSGNRVFGGRGI